MTEKEKYYCTVCEKELDGYDPQMCCSSYDCGCMGQPTNPPICSEVCWDKMVEGGKNEAGSKVQPLGTKVGI